MFDFLLDLFGERRNIVDVEYEDLTPPSEPAEETMEDFTEEGEEDKP